MAIFPRRTIQRLINENDKFLKRGQTRKHVEELNKCGWRSIGYEWEVVLLNAFSKLGTVLHEPNLGKTPDIYFECAGDPTKSFIADIVTVTDEGLKERYPVNELYQELMALVHGRGIKGDFDIKIEGNIDEIRRGGAKPKLQLPHVSRFARDIFNEDFVAFLDDISKSKEKTHRFQVENEQVNVTFLYRPGKGLVVTSCDSYTHITSLTQNIFYERLEEKYAALSSAKYDGPKAIFLCNGGCSLFRPIRDGYSYTISDIINYFLDQRPSISFVITLSSENDQIESSTINLVFGHYPGHAVHYLSKELVEALNKLLSKLPTPCSDVLNARNYLKTGRQNGTVIMSGNEIKISAREILNVLSGKVKAKHPSSGPNLFAVMLSQGRLITDIRIDRTNSEEDDEWIVVRFGDPDVAVSSYVLPQREKFKPKKASNKQKRG